MLGSPKSCEELLLTMAEKEQFYFGPFDPWHPRFAQFLELPMNADSTDWMIEHRIREPERLMQEWVENATSELLKFVTDCLESNAVRVHSECDSIAGLFIEACFVKQLDAFYEMFLPVLDTCQESLTPLATAIVDIMEETACFTAIPHLERMLNRLIGDDRVYIQDRLDGLRQQNVSGHSRQIPP